MKSEKTEKTKYFEVLIKNMEKDQLVRYIESAISTNNYPAQVKEQIETEYQIIRTKDSNNIERLIQLGNRIREANLRQEGLDDLIQAFCIDENGNKREGVEVTDYVDEHGIDTSRIRRMREDEQGNTIYLCSEEGPEGYENFYVLKSSKKTTNWDEIIKEFRKDSKLSMMEQKELADKFEDYTFEIDFFDAIGFKPEEYYAEVRIKTKDGEKFITGSFITPAHIEAINRKNKITGECVKGTYQYLYDSVIVNEITEKIVKKTLDDLIETGEIRVFLS